MCNICLQSPCLSQCPNAPEPEYVKCTECRTKIYSGEDCMRDYEGRIFCDRSCYTDYLIENNIVKYISLEL